MPAALILVDVQKNMFEPDPVYRSEFLLGRLRELISRARAGNTPVFYLQNSGSPGDPDEPGTDGWQIHPGLAPGPGDTVLEKKYPDSFRETGLDDMLKSRSVSRLVFAGI